MTSVYEVSKIMNESSKLKHDPYNTIKSDNQSLYVGNYVTSEI